MTLYWNVVEWQNLNNDGRRGPGETSSASSSPYDFCIGGGAGQWPDSAKYPVGPGDVPQSDRCAAPATSSGEAAAARAGNRDAYWSSRLRRGDPLAATALGIVRSNTALGVAANTRLISAIVARNGANPGRDAINREVHQIGVALMREHMRAVNRFGSPTAEQVAQYHFDVFEDFGLPASTFGGAPFTGSQTEAGQTSIIWMGGC